MKWQDRAKAELDKKNLTHDDLITDLGVTTRGAIGHYLSGRRQLDPDQFAALSKKLNLTMDELYYGTSLDNTKIKEATGHYDQSNFIYEIAERYKIKDVKHLEIIEKLLKSGKYKSLQDDLTSAKNLIDKWLIDLKK